jgi:hypothetical protein
MKRNRVSVCLCVDLSFVSVCVASDGGNKNEAERRCKGIGTKTPAGVATHALNLKKKNVHTIQS